MVKVWCIGLGLLVGCASLTAQHRYRTGLLPQFNLNYGLCGPWKLNVKLESRQILSVGEPGLPVDRDYRYERTDLATVLSYKRGAGQTLAAGYMLRVGNQQLVHRFIQQYSWVRPYPSFRLGHRIVTDQTFAPDEAGQYRFRYRIGIDRALNGEAVDPGESYVKLTHEYLNILSGGQYDLEIRLVPSYGYAFTDNNKLELGLDYRLDGILDGQSRSNFWWGLAWYVSF